MTIWTFRRLRPSSVVDRYKTGRYMLARRPRALYVPRVAQPTSHRHHVSRHGAGPQLDGRARTFWRHL